MEVAAPVPIPEPLPVEAPPRDFKDPCSYSNPGEILTQHIHLDLHIDLPAQKLSAKATYDFRIIDPSAKSVILDARGLNITSVSHAPQSAAPSTLPFEWLHGQPAIGSAIAIPVPPQSGQHFSVEIVFDAHGTGAPPAGGACDWLPAAQAGGRPFVFTQAQAIHARSILPCQDTPAAKAPYSALVTLDDASADLQVVMSAQRVANRPGDPAGSRRFDCPVPIPPYLFAFAVGRLEACDLSHRCRVWALPSVVREAAWEFEQVELFLKAAEKIAGPYVWGRYDLLVLPSSFPYGGMENPMLTFLTPTLLSGDRSMVSVVIHEIAHSWAGNLVSCRDCRHFWINEGFTVKLERRILRELFGTGREGVDAFCGRQLVDSYIESVGENHRNCTLVTDIQDGEDPDDYFSCVAYEKGYNFLLVLEQTVRRDYDADLHEFLREYFQRFRYQAIGSDDFEGMFREKFPESWKKVDFDAWLHGRGKCPELAQLDTSLVEQAAQQTDDWIKLLSSMQDASDEKLTQAVSQTLGGHGEAFAKWDAKQQLMLLCNLGTRIIERGEVGRGWSPQAARLLMRTYGLQDLANSEMLFWWLRLALFARFRQVLPTVRHFLGRQGRMKFIRPLFKDLHAWFPGEGLATELFEQLRDSYHAIAAKMIERDLADGDCTPP